MPALGFGTYRLTPSEAPSAVAAAIAAGFRHIDCAKIYGNQPEVGNAISDALKSAGTNVKREQLFITSKLWPTQMRPDWVQQSCELTLRELRLDHLDLLLIHWPVAWKAKSFDAFSTDQERFAKDPSTGQSQVDNSFTLVDTWKAMERLVSLKLVKSIGVCNCTEVELTQIVQSCSASGASTKGILPAVNQVEVHPGLKQNKLRAFHAQFGVHTTAYCPFGMPTRFTPPEFGGVMTHPYFSNEKIFSQCGFSPARMLLNWNLDCYNSVLVKSATPQRILENAKAELGALSMPVRWYMDAFEAKGSIRVVNPSTFRGDGKPFFAT